MRGLGKPVLHGFYFRFKQWGVSSFSTTKTEISLPIAFRSSLATFAGDVGAGAYPLGATADTTTIYVWQTKLSGSAAIIVFYWASIGTA